MRSSVLDSCSIIRVQSWDSSAPAPPKVEQALGVAWPRKPGVVATGGADIVCIGPTDWLVIASDPNSVGLMQMLDAAFEGSAFRTTNVSSALVRIRISDARVRELLAKGCALDFYPSCFGPGRCARTCFAGMPVVLHCAEYSTFECIVTLSHAEYFASWLADATTEYSGTTA